MIRSLREPAFVAAVLVLLVCAIGMQAAIARYNIYLRKLPIYPSQVGGSERVLRGIPTETANWKRVGADHIESAENEEVLGTQNYLTRYYVQKNVPEGEKPRLVQLHAAYYTGMIDTVPHVPERCFTGGGMSLTGGPWFLPIPLDPAGLRPAEDLPEKYAGKVYTVRLSNQWSTAGGGRRVNLPAGVTPEEPLKLRITEYSAPKGGQKYIAGYVFIANGGWVSSAEGVRTLAFDLSNDYAYYMKVQIGSSDVNTPEELATLASSVFNDLLGEIMTCVPDWMEVERGHWPPDNPKRARATATRSR